jgi:hypothetical protein
MISRTSELRGGLMVSALGELQNNFGTDLTENNRTWIPDKTIKSKDAL